MKKLLILLITYHLSLFTVNAQHWSPAGTGIKADATGGVYTMGVYNGNLYAAGWFYQAGADSAYNIAQWNESFWAPVGSGITGGLSNVFALCVYNGKLYAGGAFYAANDSATYDIAVWNGTIWSTAGTGMSSCTSQLTYVNTLAVYNGKLYAGGVFCKAGGVLVNNIAVWDGAKWDSLGSGTNGAVNALCVYNGNLYAGGQFTIAGRSAASNLAMWNGSLWAPVDKGISGTNVLSMAVYKGSLYVGGNFDSAGGIATKNIAKWNGSAWAPVGTGITGTSGPGTLCAYDTELYAGGNFSKAGNINVNNIASWNGVKWDSVTSGTNHLVNSIAVYDSVLYVGGEFSMAGRVSASNIAEWGVLAGEEELKTNSEEVRVYPNPSRGWVRISCHSELVSESHTVVEVYNTLGKEIHNVTLKQVQGDYVIDLSGKPAGVYLYRLIKEDGTLIGHGKLVIQ